MGVARVIAELLGPGHGACNSLAAPSPSAPGPFAVVFAPGSAPSQATDPNSSASAAPTM
ncbi:hypothetical protein [Nannocystis pusilla]|uniref:hypothetical protein n=1 Tax=Nannocystis pusilla TaxID=889268 RepID=UPI003DA608DA